MGWYAALLLCGVLGASGMDLYSFETDAEVTALEANHTRVTAVNQGVTHGKRALAVEFQTMEWPNVTFRPKQPWDWSRTAGLLLDLTNPGREPVSFYVRIDDDPRADGVKHCRTGSGTIGPGRTMTVFMPVGADPMKSGMRGLPPVAQGTSIGAYGDETFNPGHVVAFQIFLHRPVRPVRLLVDHVRLAPPRGSLERIVDPFGQYAHADWPGKLKDASEFAVRRAQEEAELKRRPALPDRDAYGGWASGPQLKATGFFRAEKYDGKWWLVTPEGRLFFSVGMDCVALFDTTIITGREYMFAWLPEKDDPLARHYGYVTQVHSGPVKEGVTFNFRNANLERKFGRDYETVWLNFVLRRLKSWGFNTVGNWSDSRLYGNRQVPYVATAHIEGDHARVSSGSDYWGKMHDPFDPRFAQSVARSLESVIAKVKGDPFCLGYFVDNELSWGDSGEEGRYGLALGTLSAEAPVSPAKRAFLSQLRQKYGEVARLNAAWGTDFASWEAMQAPISLQAPARTAAREDLSAFVRSLAREYFRTVRDTLKRSDPDHLYLGCRFAWRTPEAVEASAEFCDVVSFNIYQPRVEPAAWDFVNALNRPCIIGEFHFGALDRGMFHTGLVAAADQKERAAMYRDYVRSVVDHPAFVGCHWFQLTDEPLTGRALDGENYNIGFLTVTDTPYPEMVAAARAVHREIYTRRASRAPLRSARKGTP
ncbi:MAG: beta-galactosidase [Chloroherpetonaceae bacterium]|nr:beta-galactosidase [Chloroherpetonaceae bacterium]